MTCCDRFDVGADQSTNWTLQEARYFNLECKSTSQKVAFRNEALWAGHGVKVKKQIETLNRFILFC